MVLVSSFVTKPLWPHKFLLLTVFTRTGMGICTWIRDLVWAAIAWNTYTCWRLIILMIGIITLPVRALSALHMEKRTAKHFEELLIEIENLLWNHRKLEARFALAIKERKVLESMLGELEEEHDKAIVKIEQLEKQVMDLEIENLELRETQGKRAWDFRSKDETREAQTQPPITPGELPYTGSRKNTTKESSLPLVGVQTRKGSHKEETGNKVRPNPTGLADPVTPLLFSDIVDPEEALCQRRDAALSQSLFSALLSLLVGIVAFEAKDPCLPLVVALFVVVCMSLKSVVHFLSTVRNKPASDAVALLSFNWFILGALTYPMLPKVARFLFPVVFSCLDQTLGWFAY